jgi:hypothetical protein
MAGVPKGQRHEWSRLARGAPRRQRTLALTIALHSPHRAASEALQPKTACAGPAQSTDRAARHSPFGRLQGLHRAHRLPVAQNR